MKTINSPDRILKDILSTYPELKKQEGALRKIIETMLSRKPDVSVDEHFIERLRVELLSEIRKEHSADTTHLGKLGFFLRFIALPASMAGFTTFVVWNALPGWQENTQPGIPIPETSESRKIETPAKTSYSVDSGIAEMTPMTKDTSLSMVEAPEQEVFEYVFSGKLPELPKELPVYRKGSIDTQNEISKKISSLVGKEIPLLSIFENSKVRNFSMVDESPFGLEANVDLLGGTLSFSKNFTRWPQISCETEECLQKNRLRPSDMGNAESFQKIAADFIAKSSLDISSYHKAIIAENESFGATIPPNEIAIPETVRVVYPLKLENLSVYEEGGEPKGISIGIDVREKRVSEVFGIELHSYLSLLSPSETAEEILKTLRTIGHWKISGAPDVSGEKQKITQIPVSEPTLVLVNSYTFREGKNENHLVPSLMFSVLQKPKAGQYIPKKIFVPVVKGFDSWSSQ